MSAGTSSGRLFLSYTHADRAWAEWIAWELEQAGFSVFLQAWDIRAGHDFVHEMQGALQSAGRVVAVVSDAYLSSSFGEAEWRTAFARDPGGDQRTLIPVRVAECEPGGLLNSRQYIDLVDLSEEQAREALLRQLSDDDLRPTQPPVFPGNRSVVGTERPRFPGTPGQRRSEDAAIRRLPFPALPQPSRARHAMLALSEQLQRGQWLNEFGDADPRAQEYTALLRMHPVQNFADAVAAWTNDTAAVIKISAGEEAARSFLSDEGLPGNADPDAALQRRLHRLRELIGTLPESGP